MYVGMNEVSRVPESSGTRRHSSWYGWGAPVYKNVTVIYLPYACTYVCIYVYKTICMYAYELLYIPGRCRHSIRKGCGGFLRERLVSLICIYVYCNEWRSNRVHMYVCTILLHTPFSWLCNSLARSESLRIRPLYIYRSVFSYLVCMYYIYVCIYTVYIYT